ncbi:hypothetical protein RND81_11G198700 [Saponaria officinalis]|uniref:Retrotransposon Copia-like N-terminal domain-containing protein n=1 Tax=Saponaria officinalis TaxID=3572 RepID=A0AAW1HPE8_SAPOF
MPNSSSLSSSSDDDYKNPYDDPLFLSPSDFPGMQLVSTPFNGQNYIHWSKGVVMALGSKNKQGFLTGKTTMPTVTSGKYQQWFRCDNMVKCWILNSMVSGIKEGFMSAKSTKQLWNEILERYGQSNGPQLYQLKKELRNLSQDNLTVAAYFTKMKKFWDDIEEIEGFPECSCGVMENCTCNILKKILDSSSKEKVLTFLMGLNDTYDTLRTQILSTEPMPTINKVYSFVQQIESQKMISNVINITQDASALVVNKYGVYSPGASQWNSVKRENKRSRDDRWCSMCKKAGHTRDTCFRLHPELKSSFQNKFQSGQRFNNGQGHKFSAHVMDVRDEDTPFDFSHDQSAAQFTSNNAQKVDPALVTAVYQHMMSMMKANAAEHSESAINFADFGATDHMTSERHLMRNFRGLTKPMLVGLPDGSTKSVKFVGDVKLTSTITLHEVLFIPDFKRSLLSVGKLLSQNGFHIHFDVMKCVIQDQFKKPLAIGLREGGLYKLQCSTYPTGQSRYTVPSSVVASDKCASVKCSDLFCSVNKCSKVVERVSLLHSRLGHTSAGKMLHISLFNKKDLESFVCETCVMAKLHKLPFTRNSTKALIPCES